MKKTFLKPLLSLAVLPLAVLFLLVQIARPPRGEIQVRTAAVRPLTGFEVFSGKDVAANLELDVTPTGANSPAWDIAQRLVAGNHVLWVEGRGNVERKVTDETRRWGYDARNWTGAFDLATVPPEWGAVVLEWTAVARELRTHLFMRRVMESRAQGKIVLRRAGETLATPKVSRDPHWKLLRVEIDKPSSNDTRFGYLTHPVTLFFERTGTLPPEPPDARPISGVLAVTKWYGDRSVPGQRTELGPWTLRAAASVTSSPLKPRFPIVATGIDYYLKTPQPDKITIDWTLRLNEGWPLRFRTTFADSPGHVLVGDLKPQHITIR